MELPLGRIHDLIGELQRHLSEDAQALEHLANLEKHLAGEPETGPQGLTIPTD